MRLTTGHFNKQVTKKFYVGVGGPFCPCCTKMPYREMKLLLRRAVRRIEKNNLKKEME